MADGCSVEMVPARAQVLRESGDSFNRAFAPPILFRLLLNCEGRAARPIKLTARNATSAAIRLGNVHSAAMQRYGRHRSFGERASAGHGDGRSLPVGAVISKKLGDTGRQQLACALRLGLGPRSNRGADRVHVAHVTKKWAVVTGHGERNVFLR